MTQEEKLALLEETLETDEGTLTPDTLLEDVEEYDSMTRLAVIVMMSDEFGIELTSDMVKGFEKVGDILALMKK